MLKFLLLIGLILELKHPNVHTCKAKEILTLLVAIMFMQQNQIQSSV